LLRRPWFDFAHHKSFLAMTNPTLTLPWQGRGEGYFTEASILETSSLRL
jgi:hypothetical protein